MTMIVARIMPEMMLARYAKYLICKNNNSRNAFNDCDDAIPMAEMMPGMSL